MEQAEDSERRGLLIASLVAVALVVAGALLTAAADGELGNYAEFIGGMGGAGALIATSLVLRLELRRDRAQQEDRRREQARLVSVWPTSLPRMSTDGAQLDQDTGRLIPHPDAELLLGANLRNGSDEPVYRVTVFALKGRGEWQYVVNATTPLLPPREQREITITAPGGYWKEGVNVPVGIWFTDSAGRHWTREHDGALSARMM